MEMSQGYISLSPLDFPVSQQATAICAQQSTLQSATVSYSSAAKVRAAKLEGTRLSGTARRQSSNGRLRSEHYRLGDVAGHRTVHSACPVAHRTVRCAHRQQPPQQLPKWFGAINTPQPPQPQASKFSEDNIQYRISSIHSKTQYKISNPLRVANPFQTLSGL
jgi:hypothetical protein